MNHAQEILRLASLLATARVLRYRAHQGNSGQTHIANAEQHVINMTEELKQAIDAAQEHWQSCPVSSK